MYQACGIYVVSGLAVVPFAAIGFRGLEDSRLIKLRAWL